MRELEPYYKRINDAMATLREADRIMTAELRRHDMKLIQDAKLTCSLCELPAMYICRKCKPTKYLCPRDFQEHKHPRK